MDVMFLSSAIKTLAEKAGITSEPLCAVRLNQTFSGDPGEGSIVAFPGRVLFAERAFGDLDYHITLATPEEITILQNDRHGNRLQFSLDVKGKHCSGIATFSEADAAEQLFLRLTTKVREENHALLLFGAGLVWAASADQKIDEEELLVLNRLLSPNTIHAAEAYCRIHELPEFAAEVKKTFSREQLLSLLANQLDLMMSNGELRSVEMEFLKQEVELIGFPMDEYRKLRELMILKNQASNLF